MESLDELVQRTRGLQPWRKAFHAFNGTVIAGALTFLDPTRAQAVGALAVLAGLLLLADAVRLRSPGANEMFFRSFSSLASPREARGLASSTWYMLGILLVVGLAPRSAAVSGILVLGLADPSASVAGRRYGRRRFLGGTVMGTLTFLVVAVAILLVRHPWPVAAAAALFATVAERRSWPLDDNFAIPVVTGLTVWGVGALL